MEPMVTRFERWGELDRRTWTLAVASRRRALLTQGPEAGRYFIDIGERGSF